jgi:hypothetical protein
MKPIFSTESEAEFQLAWDRLWEGGIPVLEPSKYSDLPGYRVGSRHRTICVWLDQHVDDAIKLLADPEHVVSHPVTREEFERMADEADEANDAAVDKVHERILNWGIGGGVLAVIAYGVYRIAGSAS